MERDLFGSILCLALQRKINMEEDLDYPLTPSLCHIDGKMSKTIKSTLMKELEKSSVWHNPEMLDVVTIEGMFFHHFPSNLPETFEFVNRSIIRKLCSFSVKRIENVFDKVITPWIKHKVFWAQIIGAQGLDKHTSYKICDPVKKWPTDFLGALYNNAFQQILIKF